jgi:hypothetical protein
MKIWCAQYCNCFVQGSSAFALLITVFHVQIIFNFLWCNFHSSPQSVLAISVFNNWHSNFGRQVDKIMLQTIALQIARLPSEELRNEAVQVSATTYVCGVLIDVFVTCS